MTRKQLLIISVSICLFLIIAWVLINGGLYFIFYGPMPSPHFTSTYNGPPIAYGIDGNQECIGILYPKGNRLDKVYEKERRKNNVLVEIRKCLGLFPKTSPTMWFVESTYNIGKYDETVYFKKVSLPDGVVKTILSSRELQMDIYNAALSPRGKFLALTERNKLWIYNLSSKQIKQIYDIKNMEQIKFYMGGWTRWSHRDLAWSHTGNKIFFTVTKKRSDIEVYNPAYWRENITIYSANISTGEIKEICHGIGFSQNPVDSRLLIDRGRKDWYILNPEEKGISESKINVPKEINSDWAIFWTNDGEKLYILDRYGEHVCKLWLWDYNSDKLNLIVDRMHVTWRIFPLSQ